MNLQSWKTRIAREWLWFFFTVSVGGLFWYIVSFEFPKFWESLSRTLLRFLSPEAGSIIRGRFEVLCYIVALTMMFVYILRVTAWCKRQIRSGVK